MATQNDTTPKRLTAAQFEKAKPEEIIGCVVSKETFFALTSLAGMLPAAAETTYAGWIMSGRIKVDSTRVVDPTGNKDDEVDLTLEARYVNAERRRARVNERRTQAMRDAGFETRPLALRR